jgi:tripartite-type tricarboxylate transporter receptor subunit TctC
MGTYPVYNLYTGYVPNYKAMLRALSLLCFLAAAPALAQDYPGKTVRVIVQVPPGGVQDTLARAIANELGKHWGQSVIVENRPTAGGVLAAETVARSAPDGYTLLMTGGGTIAGNEIFRKDLPYDSTRDFLPVIVLAASQNVLVATPSLAAKNLAELVAMARAKPGAVIYGSIGIGSGPHIDAEAIAREAGVKFTHVPYKGGVPALQAVMTGEVAFAITGPTAAIPLIRQRRVKALAYGGLERWGLFPDVPTMSEQGFKGFTSGAWYGWLVPAGTPRAIAEKINTDVGRVIGAPEFRERYITGAGHELVNGSGAKFNDMLANDRRQYAARTKPLDLKAMEQ